MTRGAQRPRLRGITKFHFSRKQQTTARGTPSFSKRFGRLWNRRDLMWWRLMAGIISDHSLPRIAVCAAGYPWSSCLRALAKMNLAPGGRKPSSGESSVCTLPHSSAGSVTSSIWLNLGCRGNGSLPDTMWSITTISRGATRKFEIQRFEVQKEICACRRITFLPQRVSSRRRISQRSSKLTRNIDGDRTSKSEVGNRSETCRGISWSWVMARCGKLSISTLNSQPE